MRLLINEEKTEYRKLYMKYEELIKMMNLKTLQEEKRYIERTG